MERKSDDDETTNFFTNEMTTPMNSLVCRDLYVNRGIFYNYYQILLKLFTVFQHFLDIFTQKIFIKNNRNKDDQPSLTSQNNTKP